MILRYIKILVMILLIPSTSLVASGHEGDDCQLAVRRLKEFVDGLWKAIDGELISIVNEKLPYVKEKYKVVKQQSRVNHIKTHNECITFVSITRDINYFDEALFLDQRLHHQFVNDIRCNIENVVIDAINKLDEKYKKGLIFIVFEEMFWQKGDALSHKTREILDRIIKNISLAYNNVFFVMNGVFVSCENVTQNDVTRFINWVQDPEGRTNLCGNSRICDVSMVLTLGDQNNSVFINCLSKKNIKQAIIDKIKSFIKSSDEYIRIKLDDLIEQLNTLDSIGKLPQMIARKLLMDAVHLHTLHQLSKKTFKNIKGIIQNTSYVIHKGKALFEYNKCNYWNECNKKLLTGEYIYKPGNGFNVLKDNSNVAKYLCNHMRIEICLDLESGIGRILSFIPHNNPKAQCYCIQSNTIPSEAHRDNLPREMLICHSDKRRHLNGNVSKTFIVRSLNNEVVNFVTKCIIGNSDKLGNICYSINCIDINHYRRQKQ